ncbi:MAG TPA: GAF domain-containing protein [Verrucomicrobiae bacterium]|jgi:predicted ATPase|nr:GAF domain-containing protein [Verrucomicrobiae bacterium]
MSSVGANRRLRAYAYGLVTTVVVLLFAFGEWWAEKYVSDRSRLASTAIEIAIVLIATLAFRPIHQRVEAAVEAAFTKRRREARETFSRLRKELTSFNDPQQVLRRVVEAVDYLMGAAGCAIYLRRDSYVVEASSYDVPLERIEPDDPLAIRLRSTAAPADPRSLGSPAPGEIAFPMMAGGDLVGFLCLTPKRVEYEPDDRRAIAALTEAAGLALAALDPRLRSQNAIVPRNNLPRTLTSFVGREIEIAEITESIGEHSLVTLVGAGGVGKTRASLQVAANVLGGFVDGVWFVELAPLSNGDYIPSTIAQSVGLRLPAAGDPLENLVRALKAKHAMLVFDNCEHLVESSARVIAAILAGCPKVKVLASSRQALDIAGEQAYRLPSLEVPEQNELEGLRANEAMQCAAIALFVERAVAADRRFVLTDENAQTVADICRRLDGIPLAIELAASKTTVLSPRQLSAKLHERFRLLSQPDSDRLPRQQTLHALIHWSFDLLDEVERAAFRRLSIFAGGWTLAAAEAVCVDEGVDEWKVFELLSALVSKSLVVVDPSGEDSRYRMLHSIREFSRERLEEANETHAMAGKHARYYAGLVGDVVPLAESLEDVRWRQALAPEIDNIRIALDWSIFRGNDSAIGLSLLAGIELPELLTTPQEAIQWFEAARPLLDTPGNELTKAKVLRHSVLLEWIVGRPIDRREETATQALAVALRSSDPNEIARARSNVGGIFRDAARFDEADAMFSQAYHAPQELSALTTNAVLRNWAVSDLQRGNVDMARQRFTEVAARERPGSEWHGSALLNLGELEFAVGNYDAARETARKARETFARLNTAPLALALCNLAAYAMAVDDFEEARDCLGEALRLLKQSGARWMIDALEHHAVLGGLVGDHERAAAIVGFTDARHTSSEARQRTEQYGYERLMRALSQVYDEDALAQRMSAGARLTEEQVLELAAAISQRIAQIQAAGAA